jgi:hypothetical protein
VGYQCSVRTLSKRTINVSGFTPSPAPSNPEEIGTGAPGSPKRTWDENDGAKPLERLY